MKKLMTVLMVALLPICMEVQAQGLFSKKEFQGRKQRSEYMRGAVQEENGMVVFRQTWNQNAPSYTVDRVFKTLRSWADLRYTPNTQQGQWNDADYFKNFDFAQVNTPDNHTIVCTADEELVFTNKTLARDATRVTYKLTINITPEHIEAIVSNIIYTYNLTEHAERILAEDWITDREAFNKKGNLIRGSAKFRIKTIDTVEELFKEIGEKIAMPIN